MTYLTTQFGVTSVSNTNTTLNQAQWGKQGAAGPNYTFYGTLQSATSTTATLAASGPSAADNFYNNMVIEIVDGLGVGQVAQITAYVGASKVATVSFNIQPDATSIYWIHPISGAITSSAYRSVTFSASSSVLTSDNAYVGCHLYILDGCGKNSLIHIEEYVGSTRTISFDKNTVHYTDSTSLFAIIGEGGLATAGGASTLTLASYSSTTNQWYTGLILEILSGTGLGQTRTISDYNGTTKVATVSTAWTTQPDTTSRYYIYSGYSGTYEDVSEYAETSFSLIISKLNHVIISLNDAVDSVGTTISEREMFGGVDYSRSHTHVPRLKYFKIRLLNVHGDLVGALQTILHKTKSQPISLSVTDIIPTETDAVITRSVVCAEATDGSVHNLRLDNLHRIVANIAEPTDTWGHVKVSSATPLYQFNFIYDTFSDDIIKEYSHGFVVTINTQGSPGVSQIESLYLPAGSTLASSGAGTYFYLFDGQPGTAYYIWYNTGTNSDPAPGGTSVQVSGITTASTPTQIATATASAMSGIGGSPFGTTGGGTITLVSNVLTYTHANTGVVYSARGGTMPTNSASSLTTSSSLLTLTNQAGIGDYATIHSRRGLKYRSAQGVRAVSTVIFGTPLASTIQLAGVSNLTGGLYFGYNGTSFGILYRTDATPQFMSLTINLTGTPTTSSTATYILTLDGITFSFVLTAPGGCTASMLAHLIAANSTLFGNAKYIAQAVGPVVYFLSETPGPRSTNAYSLTNTSNTGTITHGGASVTGTFATVRTGVANTDTWSYQTAWNIDRMDGYGSSGVVLNPQRGNIYNIEYQWQGFGQLTFFIEDPSIGKLAPVHAITYPNAHTSLSLMNPSTRHIYSVETIATTSQVTMYAGAASGFIYGPLRYIDPKFSMFSTRTTVDGTVVPIISLTMLRIFKTVSSEVDGLFRYFSFSNDAGKPAVIYLYRGATLSGGTNFQSVHADSAMIYDMGSTNSLTDGTVLWQTQIAANASVTIDATTFDYLVTKVYVHTFAIQRTTSTNVTVNLSVGWVEDR